MSENLVVIRNLTKEFGSRAGLFGKQRVMRAVSEVSLNIATGRVTGVVGESGCGKSTLARLVLRLIDASSGNVEFDGVDLGALPDRQLRKLRRRMQMVFQDPYSSIDPRYTVRQALLEPLQVQGVRMSSSEAAAKVGQLLDLVGMSRQLADSYPHQLSGGQKQRIGIARALAVQPAFLVLDEPTASLDASIQAQIISLLEDLKSELGLTYMFISHNLDLVRYFCDQVVVMYLGRVVEVMRASETSPRHPYTRALLDSSFEPDPKHRRTLKLLSGEIPSAFNLPAGCAFASRCPRASDICRRMQPTLDDIPQGQVACHHPMAAHE